MPPAPTGSAAYVYYCCGWSVSQPVCSRLWCTNPHNEKAGCKTQHMPWADGTVCSNPGAKETMVIIIIIIIIISEHLYSALSFREISSVLDALSVLIEQKAFKITLKRVQGKRFVFEVCGKTVPC